MSKVNNANFVTLEGLDNKKRSFDKIVVKMSCSVVFALQDLLLGQLFSFKSQNPTYQEVQSAIKPIYADVLIKKLRSNLEGHNILKMNNTSF
jgi:hypothetical protein